MPYDVVIMLIQGTFETLLLAGVSCCFGLPLGIILFFAWDQSKCSFIKNCVMNFCLIVRSLPEILILFLIYFGCSAILSYIFNAEVEIPSFLAGTIALSIIFSAYAAKIFQSASSQIVKGEIEVSLILGLTKFQTFYHIIWPKLWNYALPGLGSLWLILLKDTVLISLIGGYDLMSRTQIIIHNTQEPFKYYILMSCVYLGLTFIFEKFLKKEKTYD